jgi:hypothetical protein
MSSYLVYRPLFITAGCARPIQTSWATLPWPSFVKFLQLAIKECKNGHNDSFFANLVSDENVIDYNNAHGHDEEDGGDNNGHDKADGD